VLGNAYLQYGAARLTAFRSPTDWLVVFEVLGFSIREIQFVNDLYAYGSCLELGGLIGEEIPFASTPELPIFDPGTNECIADWKGWAISIGDKVVRFSPSPDEYAAAGIRIKVNSGPRTPTETDLLRYAVFHLGSYFSKIRCCSRMFPNAKAYQSSFRPGNGSTLMSLAVKSHPKTLLFKA